MSAARILLTHRRLALLLCAATLLLKLLVPTGYMIASDAGRLAIVVCPGTAPRPMTTTMAMAMPGMHGDMTGHRPSSDHAQPEMPCAFAGLSAAALGAIDPILLLALIAFVIATGFAAVTLPRAATPVRLRPPPRGPPLPL